jgi:hypothetical protein
MEPTQMTQETSPAPANKDRKGKLLLLVAVLMAIVVVWYLQRRAPALAGWSDDLPKTLGEAKAQDRKVLVLFTDSPPGETTRELLAQLEKPDVKEAIAKAKLLLVQTSASDQLKKDYDLGELPAVILLDSGAKELNRREGRDTIGQTQFRDEFLSCKKITLPTGKRNARVN